MKNTQKRAEKLLQYAISCHVNGEKSEAEETARALYDLSGERLIMGTDARRNADADFEKRANQAQRKDCERTMQTPIAAAEIEVSMFDDVKPTDAAGQVSLF